MVDPAAIATNTSAAPPPDALREILIPETGERVILVPQCSYHLVDLVEHGGLVGAPADAIAPLMTPAYGAPAWHTWRGTYGRHELPIGYAMLVVRDGILRRGLQNWDSGD